MRKLKIKHMNKYPHLSLSLLLFFLLVVPYVLKIRYDLEPYPAIILPAGANKINTSTKEVIFHRTSIWGRHEKDNTWKKVDVEAFLSPIPPHFLHAIIRNSLGLSFNGGRTIYLPKGIEILSKKVTLSEVQEAKNWWSQKLVSFGYASNKIMITRDKVKFNTQTEQIIESERVNEEIIKLD